MTKPTKILNKVIKPFARHHNRELQKEEEDLEAIAANEKKVFRYETLTAATRNFNSKHKLGEGGFGPVYKGRLEDGRLVAVKRLGRRSLQGGTEFAKEAMLQSRVQHKNVVTLYGYCTHGEDKLLVYEYVPNESLDKILFSQLQKEEEDLAAIAANEKKVFRYETLAAATHNFSSKHKLGEGGFGPVYKGRLEDGRLVAVKRLGRRSLQGGREFANEAMLLSRVQHKNVVTLYGYCAHGEDKLLVYEYVPNESLDKILFSPEDMASAAVLDWKKRYDVMIGVARGLLYLHEDAHTPIIHRDIKASNILIDERWCSKIADFGMARFFPDDLTHVSNRVAGTNGYVAPEYVMHGYLSTKADVFSFGVLIIELITGQKNSAFIPLSDASTLLEWAWRLHKKRQIMEMVDPALESTADAEQVVLCAHVGLLCTQSDPKVRPDMGRVAVILSKKPSVLEEPIRPGVPGSRYRIRAHGLTDEPSTSSSGASTSSSNIASSSDDNNAATAYLPASITTSKTTTISSSMPLPYHQKHNTI